MHGLINRSLQSFLSDTYGEAVWDEIVRDADLGFRDFEAMFVYDDALTRDVLRAASIRLDRAPDGLLEDMGTYLVSHPRREGLRRLLRFSGDGFIDLLHSLEDLPDRARLALPEIELPGMTLEERGEGAFRLGCSCRTGGFCHVVLGVLRAMADDYGALVSFDLTEVAGQGAAIDIRVHDVAFAAARSFALTAAPA